MTQQEQIDHINDQLDDIIASIRRLKEIVTFHHEVINDSLNDQLEEQS